MTARKLCILNVIRLHVIGRDYITRSCMICTPYQILSGDQMKKNEKDGIYRMYGETRGAYRVLVGKPERRDHLEYIGVDGRIILKWLPKKGGWGAWTGLILLSVGIGGGLL
jgi:hypothetical protein